MLALASQAGLPFVRVIGPLAVRVGIGVRVRALIGEQRAMRVRPATASDVMAIAAIHVKTWQAAYRGQVPDEYLERLSVDRRISAWRDIVAATAWPSTGVFVSEDDAGDIIGFAHIAPSRDDDAEGTGEVTSVYLSPRAWRTGVGRSLVDAACASLRSSGFSSATLWVLDTNEGARRFYEAMGWRPDGRRKVESRGEFELNEVRYGIAL
ncbi:MAG: GNAT family N-acetyltransferase [Acidimicrobiales bacterium]